MHQVQAARASLHYNTSSAVSVAPFEEELVALEEALLGDERQRRTEKARELVDAARGVLDACYLARHDAKDGYGAYIKGRTHRPPEGSDAYDAHRAWSSGVTSGQIA